MPAMSWCELKVTGLLGGPVSQNAAEVAKFKAVFPGTCPGAPTPDPGHTYSTTAPWPDGLILKNYKDAIWYCGAEELVAGPGTKPLGFDALTQLTFHAQLIGMFAGSLFANKKEMIDEVAWFYHYCDYPWLKELRTHLRNLNAELKLSGRVINPVDIRDWKWYCGNGAGD